MGSSALATGAKWSKFSIQFKSFVRYIVVAIVAIVPLGANAQAHMATPGAFSVTPGGTASYSIPILISPGTAGMQPSLTLGYDSRSSNGLVGVGWGLGGLSAINRCPATIVTDGQQGGVNNDANDRFCLDGERLIVVNGLANGANNAEYRTQHESFSRIFSFGVCGSGPCWWRLESKSGQINEYGHTTDSALEPAGTGTGGVIRMWALNKAYDRAGNYLTVTYAEDNANGEMHPTRIDYTGNASAVPAVAPYKSVTFDYEARTDVLGPQYVAGAPTKVSSRLKTIHAYNGATEVRSYLLSYDAAQTTSLLKSATECVGATCLPATTFDWQLSTGTTQWAPTSTTWGTVGGNFKNFLADFNGDGIKDLLVIRKIDNGFGLISYPAQVSYSNSH